MPNTKTLTIIVLSYNTQELTVKVLNHFDLQKDWELIVVDNASQDNSVIEIKKNIPQSIIIQNQQNVGFAKANNQALKRAKGTFALLLNSDAFIDTEGINKLIHFLETHPHAAIVTPKVILPDGQIDKACHRGMPTPWNAFTYFTKLESVFPQTRIFSGYHQLYKDLHTTHAIDATAATAMLVRMSVIKKIGYFDEDFFFYGEDLDLCQRVTDQGYKIYYLPDVEVIHQKSASGKKNQSKQARSTANTAFYQTMKQFYQKHYQSRYPVILQKLIFAVIDIKLWWANK